MPFPTKLSGNARPPGPLPALEPESEYDVDIYTIIFLALAVFIFLRLRSVLGQRTGSERPPYDRAAPNVVQRSQDNNNVVPMPPPSMPRSNALLRIITDGPSSRPSTLTVM